MFTGIIEEIGTIQSISQGGKSSQITIGARLVTSDLKIGDSINTDGVCLTVTGFTKDEFTVDVMPETMKRTVIGKLKRGNRVNLERALRLSDRLGGHLVSGHIDGTGKIRRSWNDENAIWFSIDAGIAILKYIVEKGPVAIDGISLTVVRVDEQSFDVSIIPHTQANTTLPSKRMGDPVNIECDLIAKYLEKLQQHHPGETRINLEFLNEQGFI